MFKKGQKFSEIHKQRIGLSNKGNPPWNKGKKLGNYSEERKLKISKARAGKMIGIKHWNWKGGITTENDKLRHSMEMTLWKKSVIKRDNYTCQKCGQQGGKLAIHHINNFSDFEELRSSIENGITLCVYHHMYFHKKYSKRNNTVEQLREFLTWE